MGTFKNHNSRVMRNDRENSRERYNFKITEKKWQKYWEEHQSFLFNENSKKPKFYALSMFPYPSGELHAGHLRNFVIGDIIARYRRLQNFEVLQPIGADAFGLPAENAAFKRQLHPEEWTKKNIDSFIDGMKRLGLSYDFSRFIATCFPDYYGQQQRIFLEFLKHNLVYQRESFVNWDPVDQTVLANEQVVNGRGWRSGALVERKKLKQWFFRVTKYAEELLRDIDDKLQGWPEKVRTMQRNWIGRSEGALINFEILNSNIKYEDAVELDCIEPWFSALKSGAKTIEGRKNSSSYAEIKVGTLIKFKNGDDSFLVEVTDVVKHKNVRDYLENNDLSKIAPFSNDIDGIEKMYRDMVSDIDKHDFLAIHIRRIYDKITVYSTRPDTLYGATFLALSANHPVAEELAKSNAEVKKFILDCEKTAVDEETLETLEKKGVNSGIFVRHPLIPERKLPIYIANFVLMDYGTGAIFGCPAHDRRDFDFAKKYNLPIQKVIECDTLPFEEGGKMINSDFLDGMDNKSAKNAIISKLEKLGIGKRKINYRLRDWDFSRQRYWGCPIPVVHCEKCGVVPLDEKDLPLELPKDVEFTGKGNPLENHPTWKHTKCPKCGAPALRETDTMDTFVDSSWYFLRYVELTKDRPFNSELCEKILPVDQYVGGVEHATMHLIYCRFFTKALRDCGLIKLDEPVLKLFNQGMVCHRAFRGIKSNNWCYPWNLQERDGKYYDRESGEELVSEGVIKMSKSKSNVVDVIRVIDAYGADAARVFVMSDSPADKDFEWTEEGIESCWKYICRFHRLVNSFVDSFGNSFDEPSGNPDLDNPNLDGKNFSPNNVDEIIKNTHRIIKYVTEDMEELKFNCAIAHIREFTNFLEKVKIDGEEAKKSYFFALVSIVKLFSPFAPHLCSELVEKLGLDGERQVWPSYNPSLTVENKVTIAIQVNGRLRGTLDMEKDATEEVVRELALADAKVAKYVANRTIKKVIFVPSKLLNIVVE